MSKYDGTVELVASPLIMNSEGKILLVQSSKWGALWLIPGGHVEYGESVYDAAVREGKEETGLDLTPKHIVNIGELIFDPSFHRKAHLVFIHVLCAPTSDKVKIDGREITVSEWVTPDEALTRELGKGTDQSIRNYQAGVTIGLTRPENG